MNRFKKMISVIMSLCMLLSLTLASVSAETSWDISMSKKVSTDSLNINSNITKVTLSLPSAEDELVSDVVFVLDSSSCKDEMLDSLVEMLDKLETSLEKSNAKINIGAVTFRGNAKIAYDLTEYKDGDSSTIKDAIKTAAESHVLKGSNMPSGLLAAQQMLEKSTTAPTRQYMILVSDGLTYVYTDGSDYESHLGRTSGLDNMKGSIYEWTAKYSENSNDGKFNLPDSFTNGGDTADWDNFMSYIGSIRSNFTQYDQVYTRTTANPDPNLTPPDPACTKTTIKDFCINSEESMYQVTSTFKSLVANGVNCYAVSATENAGTVETEKNAFESFYDYIGNLGKGSDTDFDQIEKDIVYEIMSGSVTDVIGKAFNVVYDKTNCPFVLTLGGKTLDDVKTGENEWSFGSKDENGTYPYIVDYNPDNPEGEQYVWTINVPIKNAERLSLSYDLIFTETSVGKMSDYNANESATLKYVDPYGNSKETQFEIPVVTYTPSNVAQQTEEETSTPQTGDMTEIAVWCAVAGASLITFVIIMIKGKKRAR